MKQITVLLITLFLAGGAASQDYTGEALVVSRSVKERNDTIFMSLEILVKANTVRRCQSLFIVPELEAGDNSRQFPFVMVNGTNQERMLRRWKTLRNTDINYNEPYATFHATGKDTVISYRAQAPYELWMDSALLLINYELRSCNDQPRLYAVSMGRQVQMEVPEPYEVQPLVNFVQPPREIKIRNIQGQAFLDFQVGRSEIRPDFRRNPEELANIGSILGSVTNNDQISQINRIFIEGYASPDGPFSVNERLARERAEALKKYISTTFNLPEDKFQVSSVAEDWEGLEVLVRESSIANKEEVLAVITGNQDYDKRERMLKAVGGGAPFRIMLAEMFPKLRRSDFRIDFTVREYSDAEARAILQKGQNPEWLGHAELYNIAQSYERTSAEFADIIELARRLNPDDPIANINAAAVMINHGELNTARRYLQKAGNDPRAFNNLGVIYLKTGDLDRAVELFQKALSQGIKEATHNIQETQKQREDNLRMKRFSQ